MQVSDQARPSAGWLLGQQDFDPNRPILLYLAQSLAYAHILRSLKRNSTVTSIVVLTVLIAPRFFFGGVPMSLYKVSFEN